MSMILDALRKSEEQRRLGAQPDIHQPPGEAARAAGPVRQWLPMSLVVVSVLVMAWFGWQQFSPPEPVTADPVDTQAASGPPPAATPPAVTTAPPPAARTRTPVEAYRAPAPAVAAPAADGQPAAPRAQVSALAEISEFKAPEPVDAGQAAATESKPAPKAAGDEPYQPEAMSYWELPQGVRDSLPPFRISVIVYAEDPADRFLLVNGVRLREWDELQSGVVLEEIRRGGAVFRARNYRFLVEG